MDAFYRSIETLMLAASLALGLGALALPSVGRSAVVAVTLPMLAVAADR